MPVPRRSRARGRPKRPAAAKRPSAAVSSAYNELESVQPLPTISQSNSGPRRVPGSVAQQVSGQSPVFYAVLGVGGLAITLLFVVLVVVLTRGAVNHRPMSVVPRSPRTNRLRPRLSLWQR